MSRYFDRTGQPMTMREWCVAFERPDRQIAVTPVSGGRVSTAWLGLDHSWGDGPPLIFETLVFGGPLDGEMERYTTEHAAIAGHAAMVARCNAVVPA